MSDRYVLLLLQFCHISCQAKRLKCYPVHTISDELSHPVPRESLELLLCSNMLSRHLPSVAIAKTCWQIFPSQHLLVSGVGLDGELGPAEKFVCHLYGVPAQSSAKPGPTFWQGQKRTCVVTSNQRCHGSACFVCQLSGKDLTSSRSRTHGSLAFHGHVRWMKEHNCFVPVWTNCR